MHIDLNNLKDELQDFNTWRRTASNEELTTYAKDIYIYSQQERRILAYKVGGILSDLKRKLSHGEYEDACCTILQEEANSRTRFLIWSWRKYYEGIRRDCGNLEDLVFVPISKYSRKNTDESYPKFKKVYETFTGDEEAAIAKSISKQLKISEIEKIMRILKKSKEIHKTNSKTMIRRKRRQPCLDQI